jgi:hemerythrin-like domain-containing protein
MATNEPRPDVTEMTAVHQVFRDTLSAAPKLIDAVDAGDTERTELVKNFYANVIAFLAVHHEGEDELLYPLLKERAPEQRELIERVNAQHHDVEDLVAKSRAALNAWNSTDAAAQEHAAATLAQLGDRLTEHLDDEEVEMLPLCAEHISLPEWGALPAHAMQNFDGDKIWLILGLIRARFTQAQRDDMLAHMPPPAVEMWTGFGEQAYNDLTAQIGPPIG